MRNSKLPLATSLLTSLVLPTTSFAPHHHRLLAPAAVVRTYHRSQRNVVAPFLNLAPTFGNVGARRIAQSRPSLCLSMVVPGVVARYQNVVYSFLSFDRLFFTRITSVSQEQGRTSGSCLTSTRLPCPRSLNSAVTLSQSRTIPLALGTCQWNENGCMKWTGEKSEVV